jgi:hypothetical protein
MTTIERIGRTEFLQCALRETEAFMAAIDAGTCFVVEGWLDRDPLLELRDNASRFAASRPPSWHAALDGVPDFHRIIDDYPKSWVKSRMHGFYFHRFNGNAELFDQHREIFRVKHLLAGEPEDAFMDTVPSDGVIARIVCNHYPRGGGFLAEHRDPPSQFGRIQTLVQASVPGLDFHEGGLFLRGEDDHEPVWLDPHSTMGDMFVFAPAIRYGVAPIDPDVALDWERLDGRWMIIPVLIRSDHDPRDEAGSQRPA